MIQIADVKIGDILTTSWFGYRVLSVNMQRHLATVQLLYKFGGDSYKRITHTYKHGSTYTVNPDCFSGKYFTKAVII